MAIRLLAPRERHANSEDEEEKQDQSADRTDPGKGLEQEPEAYKYLSLAASTLKGFASSFGIPKSTSDFRDPFRSLSFEIPATRKMPASTARLSNKTAVICKRQ